MGMRALADDERLVVGVRPHGRVLVGPVATLFLLAPTVVVVLASVPAGPVAGVIRTMVAGAGALLLFRACLVPFLQWYRTLYAVTDRRVVLRRGVLTTVGRDVPVAQVTDIDVWQTRWDHWLGAGQIRVDAAGQPAPLLLDDVPAVEHVVAAMRRAAGLAAREAAEEQAEAGSDAPTTVLPTVAQDPDADPIPERPDRLPTSRRQLRTDTGVWRRRGDRRR